jgi:rubrerythrin
MRVKKNIKKGKEIYFCPDCNEEFVTEIEDEYCPGCDDEKVYIEFHEKTKRKKNEYKSISGIFL